MEQEEALCRIFNFVDNFDFFLCLSLVACSANKLLTNIYARPDCTLAVSKSCSFCFYERYPIHFRN
jgi:hypothetical protein